MIIYYAVDNNNRKNKLEKKVETLETNLKLYYENVYDGNELGKLFIFPGETNIEFDDDGIMSGEAFIYKDGVIEIALYDGKYCAYKKINFELNKDLRYEICIPLFSEILQYLILSAFDKLIKSSNEHAFLTVMHDNWL